MKRFLFFLLAAIACFDTFAQKDLWNVKTVPNSKEFLGTVKPHNDWGGEAGLYLIWLVDNDYMLNVPVVKGGQVVAQWGDIEKKAGEYDWSSLDSQLKAYHDRKIRATVQVNGNNKPEWMYGKIPYYPGKISVQVKDGKGSLMWWHPEYQKAYLAFIDAYAEHLENSPYLDAVLAVRMNFNPFGTEHFTKYPPQAEIPDVYKNMNAGKWIVPSGDRSELTAPSQEVETAYKKAILARFVEKFTPFVKLLMRYNVPPELIAGPVKEALESGKMGIFQTNTRPEPESGTPGGEGRYLMFVNLCRTGKTFSYSEVFANCFGQHPSKPTMKIPPAQFNYWTYLMKMNMGVSYISVYGSDFRPAIDGWNPVTKQNDPFLRDEFRRTFEFTAKYAGGHINQEQAAGGWIAFREATDTILANPKPAGQSYIALNTMTEDYTMNIVRKKDKSRGIFHAGPAEQRFGAWARRLPEGETMQFILHPALLRSMKGKKAVVRITYLDNGSDEWTLEWAGNRFVHKNTGTGRWATAEFTLETPAGRNSAELEPVVALGMLNNVNKAEIEAAATDFTLTAVAGNPVFHMAEVSRY